MSAIDTLIAAALPGPLRANFGDDVIYTPPAPDAPISTWALFGLTTEMVGQYDNRLETRPSAQLPLADVPAPKIGATLTRGETVYRIDQVTGHDELFSALALREVTG